MYKSFFSGPVGSSHVKPKTNHTIYINELLSNHYFKRHTITTRHDLCWILTTGDKECLIEYRNTIVKF